MFHARLKMISAGVLALALGLMAFSFAGAQSTGGVSVTITPDVLSIVITNTPVAFPTTALGGTVDTDGTPLAPRITNNGTTTIVALTAEYSNAIEANCEGGENWESVDVVGTDVGEDTIKMFADVSAGIGSTFIPQNPTATGDLFTTDDLAASGFEDMNLRLQLPTALGDTVPSTCSIALTVTASGA